AVALAAAALAVAGCGSDAPAEEPASPAATAPETSAEETTAEATSEPTSGPATGGPTDSAVGDLVEGFPTDVVAVPPGAEIRVSSLVESDGRRQVSLAGETAQSAEEIVAFYRDSLVAQGFTETPAALPQGVAGATFSRGEGAEVLSLTVVTADGTQQFTIGGFIAGG
ncbi:MAG: hypothetical protein ACOYXW_12680, partial [Actinomycetota bacterium]